MFMRSVLLLAAGLLAGLSAFAQLGGGSKPVSGGIKAGMITEARGDVASQSGVGKPQPLRKGHAIRPGMVIESAPDSDTVLAFPDGQIGVLGSKGNVRLNNYVYDIADPSKNDINLNLIEGNLRIVMGEIGQKNPGALHLQVGTASVALQAGSQDAKTDASLVTQGGAIAVSVQVGRLEVHLPSGQVLQVNAGQTLMLSQDGKSELEQTAVMMQSLSRSALGLQIQSQLAESLGFTQVIAEAQAAMAIVNAALKDPANAPNPAMLEILALLESLPSPGEIAPDAPTLPPATTPSGAGGGGTPCGASCN